MYMFVFQFPQSSSVTVRTPVCKLWLLFVYRVLDPIVFLAYLSPTGLTQSFAHPAVMRTI